MRQKPRYIEIPQTWDELTQADWRELLKMHQHIATAQYQLTPEDVRINTARILLKNRGVKMMINSENYLVLVSQIQEKLTWLWHEHDGGLLLAYRSTLNLLPKIQNGTGYCHQEWLGPMSHGADLAFGEFRQAIPLLKDWEQHHNETAICALAGLLYRPKATNEQQHACQLIRQPYDWDTIDEKIHRGRLMKPWQRWGIYAWFAYFCEYLTTGHFIIDGDEVCFAPLFEAADSRSKDSIGSMAQICLTLAETHVFGTASDVDNTLLLTIMQKLLLDYNTLQRIKNKRKT